MTEWPAVNVSHAHCRGIDQSWQIDPPIESNPSLNLRTTRPQQGQLASTMGIRATGAKGRLLRPEFSWTHHHSCCISITMTLHQTPMMSSRRTDLLNSQSLGRLPHYRDPSLYASGKGLRPGINHDRDIESRGTLVALQQMSRVGRRRLEPRTDGSIGD